MRRLSPVSVLTGMAKNANKFVVSAMGNLLSLE